MNSKWEEIDMYHCHIHFYLAGGQCREFEQIKEMEPLAGFTHAFSESDGFDGTLAAEADVILVNLGDRDAEEVLSGLIPVKAAEAELILLADRGRMVFPSQYMSEVKDIWMVPMPDEEIRFRFLRWQQACKMNKDYWETNQFLESAMNSIPNLVWYKDKDGVHEKVNDSFCKTVNKTKEQVQGRRHAYIWDVEQDDPACVESELEVMSKRQTCVSEEMVKSGDGVKLLTTYKSPLYDLDGSVMGTVGVAIDVTQERAYEQEINGKNHILETIFTSLDCGVMCHTADGAHIISVNRAALKILGYESQEEMVSEGFDMVAASVIEEDQERVRKCLRGLKTEGESVSVEYRVRHKDGKILHVMGNAKLLIENGEPVYQRFLLDCTEQKLQEGRIRRRHEELVQALSIDYNLVCYFDLRTGRGMALRNVNRKGGILDPGFNGEISLQECMELYIHKYVHEDDQEMLRQATSQDRLEKELAEKKKYYVNFRICFDGKVKYFQVKAVQVGEKDGNYGVVLGFCSVDAETRREMEKKVQLEDALSQANRASKAKSIFLSNMSHDIRTPMNAIVGFTALAVSHIDNKEQVKEYLEKIMTSGNHLLSLINDVLDMSRIESGKIQLEEKPCSLPDILHGLRSILQADIHAKQLELYIDAVDVVDEDIICDRLRLNQVFLNLLSNAVKYTGAGGIVSMRIKEKVKLSEEQAEYEFRIKDTGIGMSEDFVAHIFEPFEREKTSTISGIQGTGLGMAITKNIVDMMNGTIEVKSKQGAGTEVIVNFTFRLHPLHKEAGEIPELKNCRALVVDDDFNTCDSVSYMLQQIGMRAEWTLSGKEAVLRTRQAVSRRDEYRVYIIDWLLPDMNGVEVARRIRKETGGNVPIIVLSAYDWEDIEGEAGVTAFCSKPLFLSELRECLHSVISKEDGEEPKIVKEKGDFSAGRILLAEDVELNQEIAVAILGDAGFTTEVAENGQIAVEMLKKSEPGYYQVVLMDVQMPVMNGYEATKAIRQLEDRRLASIPIIAMTANAFEEDKQEALNCGMNGHIAKPIDIDNLLGTLKKVL